MLSHAGDNKRYEKYTTEKINKANRSQDRLCRGNKVGWEGGLEDQVDPVSSKEW